MPMIEAIRRMLHMINARHHSAEELAAISQSYDFRIAIAAMLVYAGNVDGFFAPAEKARVRALLTGQLGLKSEDAAELMMLVNYPELQDEELAELVGVLVHTLDDAGRAQFIAMMWDIAIADGRIEPRESELLDKVGALLRVPPVSLEAIARDYRARLGA